MEAKTILWQNSYEMEFKKINKRKKSEVDFTEA